MIRIDAASFARDEVRAEPLYTLVEPPHRVKVNQNENPWDLPEEVKGEILRRAADLSWNRYPEFHQDEVTAAVARREGWPKGGILVGNGSNELLLATFLAVGGAGATAILAPPTFSLYSKLLVFTGTAVENVALRGDDFRFDSEAIAASLGGPGRRFAVLCSPNNPTGSVLPLDELRRILALGRLVLLDAAYGEFSREPVRPLLDEFPNLVLLRTFSKARRLAALRFGCLLGDPALVAEIRKTKLPYNLNAITAAAVVHLLEREDAEGADPTVALLISERERLREGLRAAGLEVVPSEANFLLVRPGTDKAKALFASLLSAGILVRDFSSGPGLAGTLRISVGGPAENDEIVATVRRFLSHGGGL